MDTMDIAFFEHPRFGEQTEVTIYTKFAQNTRAKLAVTLLERWALVAIKPDGEDTSGRQKFTMFSPEELVERACVTADLAITEFEKRGWLLALPEPKPSQRDTK